MKERNKEKRKKSPTTLFFSLNGEMMLGAADRPTTTPSEHLLVASLIHPSLTIIYQTMGPIETFLKKDNVKKIKERNIY